MAREGRAKEALVRLIPLFQAHPEDDRLRWDVVTVLSWAGDDPRAVTLAEGFVPGTPDWAWNAAAKSARNIRDYPRALRWYDEALRRSPGNVQSLAGRIMTLADDGRFEPGRKAVDESLTRFPDAIDLLYAQAYLERAAGNTVAALFSCDRVLRAAPQHRDARHDRVLLLSSLGAGGLALDLANREPRLFSRWDLAQIRSDAAAAQINWMTIEPPEDGFSRSPAAQSPALEKRIHALQSATDAAELRPMIRRARFDRIAALSREDRPEAAVREFEMLREPETEIPAYVYLAVGDAYLALQNPEEAIGAYEAARQQAPGDPAVAPSLYWAYEEAGRWQEAESAAEHWAEQGKEIGPSERADAEGSAALLPSFFGDPASSQNKLEALVLRAPFHHDLRQKLGHVYLWRGWPRRALTEFETVLNSEPRYLPARTGKAWALLDLGRLDEAATLISELAARYPSHGEVQRLERAWNVRNLPELTLEGGFGTDSATDQNTDSFRLDLHLYSRPIRYDTRLFVRTYHQKGHLVEGTVINQRLGLGLEYEGPSLSARLETSVNRGSDQTLDLAGRIRWQRDDRSYLGARYESFSLEAPLRGRFAGINAWSGSVEGGYRFHESAGVRADLTHMGFDDGNARWSGLIALDRVLDRRPGFSLPATMELYGSTNSKTDRPYFNPEADLSATLTLDFRWLTWRRTARSLTQGLALSSGLYWQKHFGTAPVAGIRYEHDWSVTDTLYATYGLSLTRRVYDGEGENGVWIYGSMSWRF